jgi:NDP-sugar pyrophosphorylase family protein
MYAMILAAGRGERLRPLTDNTPKPLLEAGNIKLIEHHLHALSAAGFSNVVINIGHLGQQIIDALGDGSRYQLTIHFSDERNAVLETGGGIVKALPFLKSDPFLVINGDIWTDFDLSLLPAKIDSITHKETLHYRVARYTRRRTVSHHGHSVAWGSTVTVFLINAQRGASRLHHCYESIWRKAW